MAGGSIQIRLHRRDKNWWKPAVSVSANTASLPYELALAVQNAPVTVIQAITVPCQDAKNLLRSQGVPYTKKL
jgi:hypothetical protein